VLIAFRYNKIKITHVVKQEGKTVIKVHLKDSGGNKEKGGMDKLKTYNQQQKL
jgi:hypothetical protein